MSFLALPMRWAAQPAASAEGEWGGYYLDLYSAPLTYVRAGAGNHVEMLPITVLPDFATFDRMLVLISSTGSWTLTNGQPGWTSTGIIPSFNPAVDQESGGMNANIAGTWSNGDRVVNLAVPANQIALIVSRPTDFMGFATGVFAWALTVNVYGVAYLRGNFGNVGYS